MCGLSVLYMVEICLSGIKGDSQTLLQCKDLDLPDIDSMYLRVPPQSFTLLHRIHRLSFTLFLSDCNHKKAIKSLERTFSTTTKLLQEIKKRTKEEKGGENGLKEEIK